MKSVWKIMVLGLGLSAAVALGGCQSSGTAEGHHHEGAALAGGSNMAAQCDKCQVTWVKVPTDNGKGRIVGYYLKKEDACPDCKDAVASFFTTGKLAHTCKTCGGNMSPCEGH
jgi:hypothetical protein